MLYGAIPGVVKPVSRLVMGNGDFSPEGREKTYHLFDAFVEAGGTALDTAYVYGYGSSERGTGLWLEARGVKEQMVVTTKGAHPNLSDWIPRVTPQAITEDLFKSLENLGLDTIDIYLLHRDDPTVPVGPIVECLNEHHAEGRISAFGGSNWTHPRIEEANTYAAEHGLASFTASSPHLALAVPGDLGYPGVVIISGDADALSWYHKQQFPLFSWSAQAGGFFSGRYCTGAPEYADHPYVNNDNCERLERARLLAKERGCTPTQIALAWVLQQPLNIFAVIGPGTLPHLQDCVGALEIRLSQNELAWLNLEK